MRCHVFVALKIVQFSGLHMFLSCFLSVFPRIVTGNTIVRLTMVTPRLKENASFSFQQIYPTILQATKSRWNLSRNSVLWVWSNMLETVQFDRQNRHSTIFCNSAVSKQNFPFRSFFFFFQTRFVILGKVLRNVSSVCVNIYFSFFKILPEEFFLENPGLGNMFLITASWWWQTVNNRKCGFSSRKLLSIDNLNSYQWEEKHVNVIIIITPHTHLVWFLPNFGHASLKCEKSIRHAYDSSNSW